MAIPYIPLTDADKLFHITNMVDDHYDPPLTVSGILASGEANYYDEQQNPQNRTFIGHNYTYTVSAGSDPLDSVPFSNTGVSLITPYGLQFGNSLSNALESTRYSINDFSQFEPYIHYMPKATCEIYVLDPLGCAVQINPSLFLNLAVFAYNTGS